MSSLIYSTHNTQTVFVIDEDEAALATTRRLLESVRFHIEVFASVSEFLAACAPERVGCIVCDAGRAGRSVFELLDRLKATNIGLPVVVISAFGDVATAVAVLGRGAADVVEKPVRPQLLFERVRAALDRDAAVRHFGALRRLIAAHAARLSPREREVLDCVVAGQTSKAIAARFGVSLKVIEAHRARAMHKMGVRSIAEVVRMMILLTGDIEGPLAEWGAVRGALYAGAPGTPGGPA